MRGFLSEATRTSLREGQIDLSRDTTDSAVL
jgi:hypothetical protein